MTDAKSWIEERRAIHEAATDGPWVAEYSGETGDCVIPSDAQSTREAVALTRLFHRTADANAIADAHNMFLRALDAIERVLEVCDKALAVKVEGSSEGDVAMAAMAATVKRAIETAINE